MSRYLIPATTVVEILRDGVWVTHTTKRPMEFEQYLSWGVGRMTFREGEHTLRVEYCLVTRTEEGEANDPR